jgi:choline dehydrogenase-like flavoprotein
MGKHGRHVHGQHGRSPSVPPNPSGKVVDANNQFIADASVMPGVSRTNTNIPTIMIAERVAELVLGRAMPERAR